MCVWIVVQRKCFSFTKNMTRSFACGFVKDKNKAGSKNSRWNFRAKIVTAVYLQFAVWCTTLTTWFGNRGEKSFSSSYGQNRPSALFHCLWEPVETSTWVVLPWTAFRKWSAAVELRKCMRKFVFMYTGASSTRRV